MENYEKYAEEIKWAFETSGDRVGELVEEVSVSEIRAKFPRLSNALAEELAKIANYCVEK